jgi:hypothetical protein
MLSRLHVDSHGVLLQLHTKAVSNCTAEQQSNQHQQAGVVPKHSMLAVAVSYIYDACSTCILAAMYACTSRSAEHRTGCKVPGATMILAPALWQIGASLHWWTLIQGSDEALCVACSGRCTLVEWVGCVLINQHGAA